MSGELIESKAAFARRLNVSPSYISALCKHGLPVAKQGDISIDAALKWIRTNVRATAGRPSGNTKSGKPDETPDAKLRLILAQAEKVEIEIGRLNGNTIEKNVATRAVAELTRLFRDHMLNFANRHGGAIAAACSVSAPLLMAELESKMRVALGELADAKIPFEDDADSHVMEYQ